MLAESLGPPKKKSTSVVKRLKPGQKVAFVKNAGGLNRGPAEHPYTVCLGYMIR